MKVAGGTRALVTGANSGIGRATALALAAEGFAVTGTVRSEAKADDLLAEADRRGLSLETTMLEVTDPEGCASVIDRLRPAVLVNNAGYGLTAPVETIGDDEVHRILDTMLVAPMRLARLSLPHLRRRGGGHIINISSILGRVTAPLTGWYQASKHALEAVSDALRLEVARDGIQVVLVEPGLFRTAIFDDLDRDARRYGGQGYDEAFARMRRTFERIQWAMGEPEQVARVVTRAATTATPRARYRVGADAQWLDLTRPFLPDVLRDRFARGGYGL